MDVVLKVELFHLDAKGVPIDTETSSLDNLKCEFVT